MIIYIISSNLNMHLSPHRSALIHGSSVLVIVIVTFIGQIDRHLCVHQGPLLLPALPDQEILVDPDKLLNVRTVGGPLRHLAHQPRLAQDQVGVKAPGSSVQLVISAHNQLTLDQGECQQERE